MRFLKPISASPVLRRLGEALKSRGYVHPEIRTVAGEDEVVYLKEGSDPLSRNGVQMGSKTLRDMGPGWHKRHRAEAHRLAMSNAIAKKAIGLRTSFVCQEGFKVESVTGEQAVNDFLSRHWEINWEKSLKTRVRSLGVYGELLLFPPPSNPFSGHYELCALDREKIDEVLPCAWNQERPGTIKTSEPLTFKCEGEDKPRRLTSLEVMHYDWQHRSYQGDVMYLAINTLDTMMRGLSDLTPVIDWLDKYDTIAWTECERLQFLKAFLWDVELQTDSPDVVKDRAKQLRNNPPPPGSVNVHNQSEKWSVMAPDISSGGTIEMLDHIFKIVWGGLGLPEHWYYSAASVNKASGEEMRDPAFADIRDRKEDVANLLAMDGQIAVDRAMRIPGHPLKLLADQLGRDHEAFQVQVTSRDPERSAYETVGASLQSIAGAMMAAVDSGFISDEQAGKLFRQAAGALGLGEIPSPAEELADADLPTVAAQMLQANKAQLESWFPYAPGLKANWVVRSRR